MDHTPSLAQASDVLIVYPSPPPSGVLQVPGDKSISHRAAILAAMAQGESRIDGFLPAADTLATLQAVQQLGVTVRGDCGSGLEITSAGRSAWQDPDDALDLGNSGTGMRLLCGALAPTGVRCELVGDESLSRRPMARIAEPLRRMGADIQLGAGGTPPIRINSGRFARTLQGIAYAMPVASAQLKSALLLAALGAEGETRISQPATSRDHTERMLEACGVTVRAVGQGVAELIVHGPQALRPAHFVVPGDPSSAAFLLIASVLRESDQPARVVIDNMGINPGRIAYLRVLERMGVACSLISREGPENGEPVAQVSLRRKQLAGVEVGPEGVADLIDELPVLFVAAACAHGQSTFRGIGELRVKESDRIAVMVEGLSRLGVKLESGSDWVRIHGQTRSSDHPFAVANLDAGGDHRCAMSFVVAASLASGPVTISGCAEIGTSYPAFVAHARRVGLRVEPQS